MSLLSYEDYRILIADSLFEHELIDERLYEKCKRPGYIRDLPGDLHSTNTDVLGERLEAIEDEINRRQDILKKADYRVGVKKRDNERLQKRIDKHDSKMEKAVDDINKESDKIVKNINKVSDKVKKSDRDTSSVDSAFDRFKKAHNNFFDSKLTPDTKGYNDNLERYKDAADNLNNVLKTASKNGIVSKTDLKTADATSNIKKIEKNIGKYNKAKKDYDTDNQKVADNQNDIDYIVRESITVQKEIDNLSDEADKTLKKYLDNGGDKSTIRPGVKQDGHASSRLADLDDEMKRVLRDTY